MPEHIQNTFVVSADISAEEHVRMQAALQAFVDNSLSQDGQLPRSHSGRCGQAYMLAWELGGKGITVYVTGSRQVVLETKATAAPSSSGKAGNPRIDQLRKPTSQSSYMARQQETAPARLVGQTYNDDTPLGKAFITVNENGGNQPFEVFINTAKAGSETAAVSEAIGRMISYILRIASPVEPLNRLQGGAPVDRHRRRSLAGLRPQPRALAARRRGTGAGGLPGRDRPEDDGDLSAIPVDHSRTTATT